MLQDNLEDHYDIYFKSERMLPSWKGDASKTIDILNMNLIKINIGTSISNRSGLSNIPIWYVSNFKEKN